MRKEEKEVEPGISLAKQPNTTRHWLQRNRFSLRYCFSISFLFACSDDKDKIPMARKSVAVAVELVLIDQ
jgi:hypothetical protein